MNDIIFCKDFRFNEYRYGETVHRDNSSGVKVHYIGFIKHGKGRIATQKQTLEVKENEMFYIPKGCKYKSSWIAEDYVLFDSIGFLYFPTLTPNGYELQKIDYDSSIFDAFLPLSKNKEINAESIGILYRLLGKLESVLRPAPISKDVDVYERLIRLMQQDPQMTIPEYADLCKISESLLYQYAKRVSNKTPNRLRQEILCQKAVELLFSTDCTIEEICDRLGFGSAAYFRKVFESVYHKSPSKVRKEGNTI